MTEPFRLSRPEVATGRPCPDHLSAADQAGSAALSTRSMGHPGRRLHRPGLDRRTGRLTAATALPRARRKFHQSLRDFTHGSGPGHALDRRGVEHFRGCSGELNRLPRAYHSGDSDEIQTGSCVVCASNFPARPADVSSVFRSRRQRLAEMAGRARGHGGRCHQRRRSDQRSA